MEVIVAKYAGFCSGVKRAVNIALNCSEQQTKKFTLGPLIHNRHVVKALEEKEIVAIDDIEEAQGATLIIRSHGVTPEVFKRAEELNVKVIDATCPFVKKSQEIVKELAENESCIIIIVGDHGHPEVKALVGWSNNKALVVESPKEARDLNLTNQEIAVVAQTTQPMDNLKNIVNILEYSNNVKVYNTICNATHQRQNSAVSLASEVDVMVVIGGYNSANTRKLAKISAVHCKTYHIEHAEELKMSWFMGIEKVGITAGASTPDRIIEEVVEKMVEFNQEQEKNEMQIEVNEKSAQNLEETTEVESSEQLNEQDSVQEQLDDSLKTFNKGDVITGHVVQVSDTEVMVDIGGKSEGIIPLSELSVSRVEDPSEIVQAGDEIKVQVIKVENDEGHPILSRRRVERNEAWEKLEEAFENNTVIEGTGLEVVKGGLLVNVGLRGFIPASLVDIGYVENLEEFVGKELRLKVIELDKSKNKIVLSRKVVLEEELEKKRQTTWEELEEGQERRGIVRRLTDFGAFVDIGGIDGLLHVSEISWGRVDHPSDVLSENQEINVKVLNLDKEKERVSLGLKQLTENPWTRAEEKYPVNEIFKGKVLRTTPFGAFVEIEPGVEGLVHISQLAEEHVEKTEDVVSVGDEVEVKVLSVDSEAQRMSLSLKEAKEKEATKKEIKKEPRNSQKQTQQETELPESGVKLGDIYGELLKKRADEKK